MYTTIQKWGNSRAVRLPKAALEKAGLKEKDTVEIRAEEGLLVIVPYPAKKHLTLEERSAGYQGDYQPGEWDTGKPSGKEIW